MIVVDASVAAKWVLPEAGSDAANAILSGPEDLLAPDIIRIEVAGAVTRRVRLNQLSAARAQRICDRWLAALSTGAIALDATQTHLTRAIEHALSLRHPLADCIYLAVAERYGARLVTADRTLYQRALHRYPDVLLLGSA